jgi:TRAP-type C4-dicarboxylate transport system permease small subunit
MIIQELGNRIALAIDRACLWLGVVAAISIVFMMLNMLSDGLSRQFFGSIPGSFETSKVLMVIYGSLPLGYTQMRRRHLYIDLCKRNRHDLMR